MQGSQAAVSQPSIVEQWFKKMEDSLARRRILHVQVLDDGSVIAITKYCTWGAFLAGRELIDDIRNILSHVRAARDQQATPFVVGRSVDDLIEEMQELKALLKAERNGRTGVTDALRVGPYS